jgi:hypothetical protein
VKQDGIAAEFLKHNEQDFWELVAKSDKMGQVRSPELRLRELYDMTGEGDPNELMDATTKKGLMQMKIRKYLGRVNKDESQRSGKQVPDLGLAFYSLKLKGVPADCLHLVSGRATYADGSQYNGAFKEGKQHGKGILTQYNPDQKDDKVAVYDGEWVEGARTGKGTYTYFHSALSPASPTASAPVALPSDLVAYRYSGAYKDGRRDTTSGDTEEVGSKPEVKGKMEVFDADLKEEFGYSLYDGGWKDDMRHGRGKMEIERGGDKFTYEGEFAKGKRHGSGKLTRGGDASAIVYEGNWVDDFICTDVTPPPSSESSSITSVQKGWSVVGEHVYHGQFTKDGKRQGYGILYHKKAIEEILAKQLPEREEEIKSVVPELTTPPQGERFKHVAYEGEWKRDLFDGKGMQYFESGTYDGQFSLGQRDGRGTWDGKGDHKHKKWTYRPQGSDEDGPKNWQRDKMHGIAIIEDESHVHENVIYNNGVPQMPFTEEGPPKTMGIGSKISAANLFFGKTERYEPAAIEVKAEIALNDVLSEPKKTHDKHRATNDEALGVLVRQPTLLETPEEDIWIDGGTGGNEVLNGIYFRLQGTFGRPLYKLVKKLRTEHFEAVSEQCSCFSKLVGGKEVTSRYMYRHPGGEHWVIAGRHQWGGAVSMTHWAHVKSTAEHPKDIEVDAEWYVWHEQTKMMRRVGEEDIEIQSGMSCRKVEAEPVDRMTLRVVAGYEVLGLDHVIDSTGHASANFLMRHPTQFFGRPVYESSRSDQYLFWLQEH